MPGLSIFELSGLVVISMVISLTFLWLIGHSRRGAVRAPHDPKVSESSSIHFLFEGDTLADNDLPIQHIATKDDTDIQTWSDLRSWLGGRFGALPSSLSDIEPDDVVHRASTKSGDRATLTISRSGEARRVTLTDSNMPDAQARHRAHLMENALGRHMAALNEAPCAICLLDTDKQPAWQNELFAEFSEMEATHLREAATKTLVSDRVRLKSGNREEDRHFELRKSVQSDYEVLYAIDVTKVVQAERVRREFVQTLTKTFANLTTGLAVFDRHRQLALFNPALVDLTHLPAVFLSGRPSLHQFFDRLRDHKVLPEPKNYSDWRTQIDAMIASASDGLYLEDWCLPAGLTYRVTGRPHPDGAIAFLFEDISDEISLTRRFRSQLDLHMSVLHLLDEAVAVIGPGNMLVMCNAACSRLLSIEPDKSFADFSANDFFSACHRILPDEKTWADVGQAVKERRSGQYDIAMSSGGICHCFVKQLPGQSVMIKLSTHHTETQPDLTSVSA